MENTKKVVVVLPVKDRHKNLLMESAPDMEFSFVKASELSKEEAMKAEVIIGNVPVSLIKDSENLKWLQLNSAGADPYIVPGAFPESAILTNSTGAYGLALSEHALATLLSMLKKLPLYGKDQMDHVWQNHGTVGSIWGSKTLVVGLGNIGGEFAKRMHALGSSVTGIKRSKGEKPEYLDALYQMDKLEECLAEADIVFTALPGTNETKYLFNKDTFEKMKNGAYFLNYGRGNAVDSEALLNALNSGKLAGAAVDVTDPEPLPEDHPLWDAKNIVITPHVSGKFYLPETFERVVKIASENLKRYVANEMLQNQVDFHTGYCKR